MKRITRFRVSKPSANASSVSSVSARVSARVSRQQQQQQQQQRRGYAASSSPTASSHSPNKGKERVYSPTLESNQRSHARQMKLTRIPPPGLRLISSTPGVGPTRLGMDSEADLGRHFYLNKVLEQWAAKPATRMTLRQLIFFGRTLGRDREKILKSANYVRQELPVRIAHRIRDLQALPFVVMTNQHLEDVYQKYWSAFETFRRFPHIKSMDDNEKFCNLLRRLLDDHLTIIPSLTIGIVESSHHLQPHQLDKFMERMLRSRISRRVLAEQHIALSEALDDPFHFFNEPVSRRQEEQDESSLDLHAADDTVGDHVGIIYTRLSVASVVNKGIKLLAQMFESVQGVTKDRVPRVVVDGDLKARFAYIPEHLEYIVFELLKNAIRATIRKHAGDEDPGTVRVTIVEGPPEEDLIIRISDCGGGLPDLIAQLSAPSRVAPVVQKPVAATFAASPPPPSSSGDVGGNGAVEGSSVNEQQYPIPFPETGHIGGYPPRGSRARLMHPDDETMPVTLSDDTLPGSMRADAASFYAEPWAEASLPSTRMWAARGGVGSAGGVGGSTPPNEFGTVGTSTSSGVIEGGYSDPLIDALCSFSNVRKRLEIEAQSNDRSADQASAFYGLPNAPSSPCSSSSSSSPTTSPPAGATSTSSTGATTNSSSSGDDLNSAGLGTRDRFDALKTIGKFKGTVTEQVSPSPSSSTSVLGGTGTGKTMHQAMEGTGPAALHTVQVETGLGLPMAKVYCDFFGGSLSFRSLDGHSTDIYVRLPKLGTNKETIEEIVL